MEKLLDMFTLHAIDRIDFNRNARKEKVVAYLITFCFLFATSSSICMSLQHVVQ